MGPAWCITQGVGGGSTRGGREPEIFLKATATKISLQVEKIKVEFTMQEGFLIDSFYPDSGVLLTYIYFLITRNCVINLSLDSACHTNDWRRI